MIPKPPQPSAATLSRRTILKSAAAAAPLVIFPRILSAGARHAQPNSRLGLGFIGLGIQGRDHLGRFLKNPAVQVRAVCDVDTTRLEHSAKMVNSAYSHSGPGGCSMHNDHRELLAAPGIDAVLIATPDHWHAHEVIDAARLKKDIYCEKPLSLTLHEAKRMLDESRKAGIVFQTGSQQRTEFGGQFRRACELVHSGRIGTLLTVHVGVPHRGPGITTAVPCDLAEEPMEAGLDWDRWLGPAPMRPYNSILSPRGVNTHYPDWRLYREYSGGMLTDFGAHHFDIAQWGMDMDRSGPVKVLPPNDPKAVHGARFIYENGVELIHGGPIGITFTGETGWIYVDRGTLKASDDKLLKDDEKNATPVTPLPRAESHHADWLECIKTRKAPICDIEVGARSVACCHLMNLAYQHRKPMNWNPQAWEFTGAAATDANPWRDYTRRAGYELPA